MDKQPKTSKGNCKLREKEVTPVEDLMQEHGILNRILLIYEEIVRRLNNNVSVPSDLVLQCATIIRNFIEDYHEKNEENYIFPVVNKCPQYHELIQTLLYQHQLGRVYTDNILSIAQNSHRTMRTIRTIPKTQSKELAENLINFVHMYRAHESREDTEVFRAFHSLTSDKEYHQLGEQFEKIEEKLFGKDDYDTILGQIEHIEELLNINDLNSYSQLI